MDDQSYTIFYIEYNICVKTLVLFLILVFLYFLFYFLIQNWITFRLEVMITYLIIFSMPNLLFRLLQCANIPPLYQAPTLILNSRQNWALSNISGNIYGTNFVSMDSTDLYVSRLTNSGKLQIFDIQTKTLKFNLFNSTNNPNNLTLKSYDIFDKAPTILGTVFTDNSASLYYLYPNGTITLYYKPQGVPYIRQNIQIFDDEYYVYVTTGINTQQITRRTKTIGWTYNVALFFPTNYYTSVYNTKKCRASLSDTFYKIAIWKRNCILHVINCPINNACTTIFLDNSTVCNYTEYNTIDRDYFKVDWNHDCTKIMYDSKRDGIKIVDVIKNKTVANLSISYSNATLNGFWFMDQFDLFVALSWTDGRFEIYNLTTNFEKTDEKFVDAGTVTTYRRSKQMFFVSNGSDIFSYSFGCNSSSFSLDPNGLCLPIPVDLIKINTTNNTTPSTTPNTTQNESTDTNINNTTNTTTINNTIPYVPFSFDNKNLTQLMQKMNITNVQNITNNKFFNSTNLTQTQRKNPMFQLINQVLSQVKTAIQISFVVMRAFPLAYFCMKYINFWSICILYLVPDIYMTYDLKRALYEISNFINVSAFELMNIKVSLDTNIVEKFSFLQTWFFGFSSDFFNSNIENFCFFCFSIATFGLTFCLLNCALKGHRLYQKLLKVIDYRLIILGQFIAIMHSFVINLLTIYAKSYQPNFIEKVNMSLHIFFLIFSGFASCLAIILLEMQVVNSQDEKVLHEIQQYDSFFESQCHYLMPIPAFMKRSYVFLGFNSVFFCIPLFSAIKRKKYRIIYIIKSLYLPIINSGMIILEILKDRQMKSFQNWVGLVVIFFVLTGAVHEIGQLIVTLIYNIVVSIVDCRKNKIFDSQVQKTDDNSQVGLQTRVFAQIMENNTKKFLKQKSRINFSKACIKNADIQTSQFHQSLKTQHYLPKTTPKIIENKGQKMKQSKAKNPFRSVKKVKGLVSSKWIRSQKLGKQESDQMISEDMHDPFPIAINFSKTIKTFKKINYGRNFCL